VDNTVVFEGDTVVVADTAAGADVRYQVLCRAHYRSGDLGLRTAPEQLSFD
jgi:thymidine kinase